MLKKKTTSATRVLTVFFEEYILSVFVKVKLKVCYIDTYVVSGI